MFERLEAIKERNDAITKELTKPEVISDIKKVTKLSKEQSDLSEIIECYDAYLKAKETKEDTYDIETQLNQIARDLSDTYETETGNLSSLNEELLIAQGNYEGLTEAIKKQQQELLNSSIADNERAQTSTAKKFQNFCLFSFSGS